MIARYLSIASETLVLSYRYPYNANVTVYLEDIIKLFASKPRLTDLPNGLGLGLCLVAEPRTSKTINQESMDHTKE